MNKDELITLRENDPVKYAVTRSDEAINNFVKLNAQTIADFKEVFKRLRKLEKIVADLMLRVKIFNEDLDIMEYSIYEEFQDVRKRLDKIESETVNKG